jgi:rhodanese-related sulfurtransferase
VRRLAAPALVVALLLGVTAPAGTADYPISFISVDELKAHLDRGGRADVIDVRKWDQYVKQHIRGARSMPIRAVPDRAYEIAKSGLVVFY